MSERYILVNVRKYYSAKHGRLFCVPESVVGDRERKMLERAGKVGIAHTEDDVCDLNEEELEDFFEITSYFRDIASACYLPKGFPKKKNHMSEWDKYLDSPSADRIMIITGFYEWSYDF